jgi:hypothetical protein
MIFKYHNAILLFSICLVVIDSVIGFPIPTGSVLSKRSYLFEDRCKSSPDFVLNSQIDPSENNNGNDYFNKLSLENILSQTSSFLGKSIPIPFGDFNEIALAYPLALLAANTLFFGGTSILLDASFLVYWYLGRTLMMEDDDDDDDEVSNDDFILALGENGIMDLTALGGAFATAGLLSPQGLAVTSFNGSVGVGALALGSALTTLAMSASNSKSTRKNQNSHNKNKYDETDSEAIFDNEKVEANPDKLLMDLWDEKFKKGD